MVCIGFYQLFNISFNAIVNTLENIYSVTGTHYYETRIPTPRFARNNYDFACQYQRL